MRKGEINLAISITKLKKDLMERIDTDNLMEVEKVERYCDLVRLHRRIERDIRQEELIIETVNASQKFEKSNPLLNDLKTLNSQINTTGNTIKFKREKKKAELSTVPTNKKVSLI